MDYARCGARQRVGPIRRGVIERRGGAVVFDRVADKRRRRNRFVGVLKLDELRQIAVGLDLLLDLAEGNQLLGELGGVVGFNGSWFCNWVVSSVKNVLKFEVKLGTPLFALLAAAGVTLTPVLELTGAVMASSLCLNVDAAGLAAGVDRNRGDRNVDARDRRTGCVALLRSVLREGLAIAAQIEAEAAAIGAEAGIPKRLLQGA